jgi:hypothetical protein
LDTDLSSCLPEILFPSDLLVLSLHEIEPFIELARTDGSVLLGEPVFHNDLVEDLSAGDASPSEKMLADPVKLFVNHHSSATMAPHDNLLDRDRTFFPSF